MRGNRLGAFSLCLEVGVAAGGTSAGKRGPGHFPGTIEPSQCELRHSGTSGT